MLVVELTVRAAKQVRALPRAGQRRIASCLDHLQQDPWPAAAKKLRPELELYRLRVGELRIVYQQGMERLIVLEVLYSDRRRIVEVLRAMGGTAS